ncbi:MAG: fumarate hydratase [Chloroflexi bacterium]|nr:fumarate hydratase [Chloroflexota bacterium]
MRDLKASLLELVRLAATDLPPDVEKALREAREREAPGSAAAGALDSILENAALARANSTPICQDTGTPIFYIRHPEGWSTRKLREQIREAVAEATERSYLRPNAVDALTGKNSGNNLGDEAFPTIHFEEIEGNRGSSYYASKEALFRKMEEANPDSQLAALETRLADESNRLGIGPMGFGGATTVLGVKMTNMHRLPASYFVSVSYMCWAHRRRRMTVRGDHVMYE